ncbi:MAG: LexA repressor, partial [Parcubacteria group bacterium GW2011_GWB1_44_7]
MLTKKQKQILDFVKKYSVKKGFAPALEEIKKHFRLRSVATIHQHIAALCDKGYIHHQKNQPRGVEIIKSERMVNIPLLGTIAAGQPIEAIENREMINIPESQIAKPSEHFALRVAGNSMIDEGILNGDVVIIKKQQTAENGETVVALLDNYEVTLKKIYKEKNGFRLQPANPKFKPIFTRELTIQGKVVNIIRSFDELKDKISKREFTNETIKYLEKADIGR